MARLGQTFSGTDRITSDRRDAEILLEGTVESIRRVGPDRVLRNLSEQDPVLMLRLNSAWEQGVRETEGQDDVSARIDLAARVLGAFDRRFGNYGRSSMYPGLARDMKAQLGLAAAYEPQTQTIVEEQQMAAPGYVSPQTQNIVVLKQ